jgi:hypothetical protein
MKFLKLEQQLKRTIKPYTGPSLDRMLYVKDSKEYMMGRSIKNGCRNMQNSRMGVK